jgi:ABC-2 type transport system ATP-binding protein
LEFKNLVRLLAQRGKTLFISSHILSELGEMCDTMLFIDNGKIVHHGSSESLRRGTDNGAAEIMVDVILAGPGEALAEWAGMNPGWRLVEERRDGARLAMTGRDATQLAASLKKMIQDGLPVIDFHREERRLEDAFVEMLKEKQS